MCRRRGLGAHYVTILTWDSHFNLPNLEIKEVSVCDSKTSNNTEASDYVQGLEINQNIDFYIGMKAGNVGIPPLNWGKLKECRSCQEDNRDFFFSRRKVINVFKVWGGSSILKCLTLILRFMRWKSKSIDQQRTTELKIKNILTEKNDFLASWCSSVRLNYRYLAALR